MTPAEQAAREAQIRARAQHRAMEMLGVLRDVSDSDYERRVMAACRAQGLVEEIEAP